IITMVPKSEHSRGVCESILPALGPGKIYIDMSTISPDVSVAISEKVKATGAQFADCPVVKSRPAALKGELGIYAGCDEELFPAIEPVLRYMGSTVLYMGKNGMGLVMKLCHNTLVAQIQNGVNETLALANRFGIDAYRFHEAVVCGGAQNFYLDAQYENLAKEDWTTAFSIENMHKDLGLTLDLAAARGAKLPGAQNAKRVYDLAMERGFASSDFRTTFRVVREENEKA
nr:NAD(P)-dependent oxidoreductase [Clostridia bacterium]